MSLYDVLNPPSVTKAKRDLLRLPLLSQRLVRLQMLRQKYGGEFAERVAAKADYPRSAKP